MNTLVAASNFVENNNIFISSKRTYSYFGKKCTLYFCIDDAWETHANTPEILCLRLTDIFSALKLPKTATLCAFYYCGVVIEKNKLYREYFLTIENAIKLHENLVSYK